MLVAPILPSVVTLVSPVSVVAVVPGVVVISAVRAAARVPLAVPSVLVSVHGLASTSR